MALPVIGFAVLVAAFLWGSLTAVNAGLIALVAASVVGTLVADLKTTHVIAQFPAGLFFILAGATLLFSRPSSAFCRRPYRAIAGSPSGSATSVGASLGTGSGSGRGAGAMVTRPLRS